MTVFGCNTKPQMKEYSSSFIEKMKKEGQLDRIIDDLMNHRIDPYSMVERIISEEITKHQ